MKKIISSIMAAVMMLAANAGCISASAAPVPEIYPVSGGVIREATEIDISENNGLRMGENVPMADANTTKNPCEFFNYGSDYGYKDLATRPKAAARQRMYDTLKARCEALRDYTGDLSLTTLNVGGENRGYYLLPKLKSENHAYIMESSLSSDDVVEVYYAFRNDHPEYYWLSYGILYGSGYIYPYLFDDAGYQYYNTRRQLEEAIDSNVSRYIDSARTASVVSEYKIVKQVHDDIMADVTYGYDDDGNPLQDGFAHNIVGVLDGDESTQAVCEGYSKAFQLVLNALGLDVIYVVGYGNGDHAWDMVRLDDDKYYWVDVTWDDQYAEYCIEENLYDIYDIYAYYFFAKGEQAFCNASANNHIPDSSDSSGFTYQYALPTVPDDDFDTANIRKDILLVKNADMTNGIYTCDLCFGDDIDGQNISVMVALYDENGVLADVDIQDIYMVPKRQLTVYLGNETVSYSSYKFMIWDGLTTMKQIIEAK